MFPPSWIWPVIASPFIGSFLGVVVARARAPRTIVFGRSSCSTCGTRLGPLELVPLASWVALRGHCRHCGGGIDPFHPAIELAAIGIALWSAALASSGGLLWASCVLGWALLSLAAIDWRYFLLPDFLTLPLIGLGLLAAGALDPATLAGRAIGMAAGFLFVVVVRQAYWLLRRREGIGLGDAKLLAAAGAWVAWDGLPSVVLVGAFAALASTLLHYVRGGSISSTDRVPFGTFLCLGTWIVWLYGPLG